MSEAWAHLAAQGFDRAGVGVKCGGDLDAPGRSGLEQAPDDAAQAAAGSDEAEANRGHGGELWKLRGLISPSDKEEES
jgi:hypothetical protein